MAMGVDPSTLAKTGRTISDASHAVPQRGAALGLAPGWVIPCLREVLLRLQYLLAVRLRFLSATNGSCGVSWNQTT
jgi:hypothetical protein